MEKHFATYNQSLALKELGFDMPCLMYIDEEEDLINDDTAEWIGAVKCLLKSQVFEWFREKYNLYHVITIADLGKYETGNPDFQCAIYSKDPVVITNMDKYKTYEEAESTCIDKLIELLQHDK